MADASGFDPGTLDVDDVKVKVYSAIHIVCDVQVLLTQSTRFEEDLKADDSAKKRVLREVEKTLNISFDEGKQKDVKTVGDVVDAARALKSR
ncbi:hypothetical protein ABZT23_39480 [Streptomyces sp. NPDC005386]|uniref:hypothetical protein n=1 Tax=Streptomyces sp. NPDC005386 TaxID=3154562 RepID=UPI00339FA905